MPQSKEAHRAYMRERRARERNGTAVAVTDTAPLPVVVDAGGTVAQAVEAQLAQWPKARFQPVDAEIARNLAWRLDGSFSTPQASGLSRELAAVLDRLRSSDRASGALARLRREVSAGTAGQSAWEQWRAEHPSNLGT